MRTPVYKKIITSALICLFVLGSVFVPFQTHTPQAEANIGEGLLGGAAACAGITFLTNQLAGLLSSFGLEVPTNDGQTNFKDQFLDCIIYQVGNVLIQDITDNIVDWIQSGFDGNPGFIQDPEKFYLEVADQAVGDLIDTKLSFLCSAWRPQIQLGLLKVQQDDLDRIQCGLSDVIGNVDDFINGDFKNGGWQQWVSITQTPQNSPYGAFIIAKDELTKRIVGKTETEKDQLEYGKGFFTKKTCEIVVTNSEVGEIPDSAPQEYVDFLIRSGDAKEVCKTATPGSIIEDQINESLGDGKDRLKIADELNEIISALMTYLIQDVLLGDEGLAGYNRDDFNDRELPELPEFEQPSPPGTDLSCRADLGPGPNIIERSFLQGAPYTIDDNVGNEPTKDRRFRVPIQGHYPIMEADMDFYVPPQWQPEPYDGGVYVFSFRNVGGDTLVPNPAIHTNINGTRRPRHGFPNHTGISFQQAGWGSGLNGIVREPLGRQLPRDAWYHMHVEFNAYENRTVVEYTEGKGLGGALVGRAVGPAHHSFFPQSGNMYIIIGAENLDENIARLTGAQYQNIEIKLTPGEPVCRQVGPGRPRAGQDPRVPGIPEPPDDA